ncbi:MULTISPECIES: hypothetical protein [unclassified Pseudomonas]|uniref:hypothetical protein n=1 Tax=unclassified Pseudomonas TaxID=196821 RepID=UPI000A1E1B0C|nr:MULTISPECIES: hypothetical protein [unclassified Pseudomonas]
MRTKNLHLEQRVAALQSDLNQKDEQIDALAFTDKDRELSRRDWFEEAQRLENENSAIRLQAGGMQMEIDELRTKLAERDALLENALDILKNVDDLDWTGEGVKTDIEAILSASAEPSAAIEQDGLCGVEDVARQISGRAKARAALDCPDCGDTGVEPCSKHGWKP